MDVNLKKYGHTFNKSALFHCNEFDKKLIRIAVNQVINYNFLKAIHPLCFHLRLPPRVRQTNGEIAMLNKIILLICSSVIVVLTFISIVLGQPNSQNQETKIQRAMSAATLASGSSSQYNNSSEHIYEPLVPMQKCSEQTATMLARLYYLANPYEVAKDPMQITNYVRANASNLGQNSEVIKCARELGELLINQGIQNFNANGDRERMYNIGQSAGVDPLVTKRAADELYNGSADLFFMGQELVWLSQVIPYASVDNWDPFNNTGTDSRRQFYQLWPLVQLFTHEDEYLKLIMDQAMSQMQPIVEYQVFILASMIQN